MSFGVPWREAKVTLALAFGIPWAVTILAFAFSFASEGKWAQLHWDRCCMLLGLGVSEHKIADLFVSGEVFAVEVYVLLHLSRASAQDRANL